MIKTFIIVNPQAGNGACGRRWPLLVQSIHDAIGRFDYGFTNGCGAGAVLAQEAVAAGFRRIIAVGGDGTLNEVINGLYDARHDAFAPDVIVGAIPMGSGIDFWKNVGLPEYAKDAIARLAARKTRRIDAGVARLHCLDGKPTTRVFCNVGDVGLGGETVDRAKKLPDVGKGKINYLIGAVQAFWQWESVPMTITLDGARVTTPPLIIALIANGAYCGGGMQIAPHARPDDGVWDFITIEQVQRWQMLELLPKLYAGTLMSHPAVHTRTAREIAIRADFPLKVTLDGEVAGILPAKFSIRPKALTVQI